MLFVSAWLEGEEDPVIERVNQRIEDLTGLTVKTAELLQVMMCTFLSFGGIHVFVNCVLRICTNYMNSSGARYMSKQPLRIFDPGC